MKIFKLFILLLVVIYAQACSKSSKYQDKMLKEDLRQDINLTKMRQAKPEAFKTVILNAKNFEIKPNNLPDNEYIKRIKILGAPLNDVIALLTEATDQDVLLQLQSNTILGSTSSRGIGANNSSKNTLSSTSNGSSYGGSRSLSELRQSNVYVSASNIGFGRLLKKTVGDKMSIQYYDGTYYFGHYKTLTMKIPSVKGLAQELQKTLKALGAVNLVHDSITSSITFSTREKEYIDIMKYLELLRNNLYVVEYEISIYNVELKDIYSLGINWSLIPKEKESIGFISKTSPSYGSVGALAAPASFGAILNTETFSASFIAEALKQFGTVESIQKPKLLGMAGTDVKLIDGLDEPYIKELKTTSVGNSGVQTSTVSGSALSGLEITLNSNIMDTTVITDIDIKINDIVGYSSFSVGETTYSQPKVQTKDIKSTMRVQPGVPIIISGLFRHRADKGYKGIPGIDDTSAKLLGGSEYKGTVKTEMVIIVTPRVIKYVMK